jgi:SAM-dependent methyltransferase
MPGFKERLKWILFPGMNLHARQRRHVLPPFFGHDQPGDDRIILDAGCGNGMLSYAAYLKGNRVVGVSIKDKEVEGCRRLFNKYLRVPEDRLSFRIHNLYDVKSLGLQFNEIICSEVLEHIDDDARVCQLFSDVLKPGGVLHLCCPNAAHPDNMAHHLDEEEAGGHVRPGYTIEAYRALLEPLGFRINASSGLGGPIRQFFNRNIIRLQTAGRRATAVAVFLAALPWLWLDPRKPAMPYSIYVCAVKEPH